MMPIRCRGQRLGWRARPHGGCPHRNSAAELSRRLAESSEAVCRHYLSNGRRQGRYWIVGDAMNAPGRSLYVRLHGPSSGRGARGQWTDAATGEHGDLLDLIRLNRGLVTLRETLDEAGAFLGLAPAPEAVPPRAAPEPAPQDRIATARRLFRAGLPVRGTPAAVYLTLRGLAHAVDLPTLRYHPRCGYRLSDGGPVLRGPALLAAVTDGSGQITGVQRTWLAPGGGAKASLVDPRRALGQLTGGGVRVAGQVRDVLVVGEGVETVLSLRAVLPRLPLVAGLSAHHLAALALPSGLRRLYVARDNDPAGLRALEVLRARAETAGVPEVCELVPLGEDFNADLVTLGPRALAAHLAPQLDAEDAVRYLRLDVGQAGAARTWRGWPNEGAFTPSADP